VRAPIQSDGRVPPNLHHIAACLWQYRARELAGAAADRAEQRYIVIAPARAVEIRNEVFLEDRDPPLAAPSVKQQLAALRHLSIGSPSSRKDR
jgi:hypothetical protein